MDKLLPLRQWHSRAVPAELKWPPHKSRENEPHDYKRASSLGRHVQRRWPAGGVDPGAAPGPPQLRGQASGARGKGPSRRRLLSIISSPEDLVGRAVQAVLLGEERPGEGRRLSAKNRRSTAAFVAGLRSVVDSQLSNLTRSAEANSEHVPVGTREDPDAVELADLSDLARLIERRDLKAVLFRHLREWAAGHAGLLRVIGAWEQSFEGGDRIGESRFDRNLVQRVRSETQAFLLKLARESDSQARSGRGMVW